MENTKQYKQENPVSLKEAEVTRSDNPLKALPEPSSTPRHLLTSGGGKGSRAPRIFSPIDA